MYCVLQLDLRFVYCGQDKQAAEAAHVPGTHLAVGHNYGFALRRAVKEIADAKSPVPFVPVFSPPR